AELLKQLGGNGRQVYRLGFRFARHTSSFGASYALNTKLLTGPVTRIERMQYAMCDWNVLRRNREQPSPTIRRIDFRPIGNDSVHLSRRACPSARVMPCTTPSTGFVTGDTFSAGQAYAQPPTGHAPVHERPHPPRTT
ncbi:hypothetical protein, partial [Burkholderia aenigmatica]|uniref:hypothetical protein n=1 Tax=Burkholderia aenigmatica TaxID=2015348 RepID=UPI0026527F17